MAKNTVTHGELLEYGKARYQFDEKNNMSYYAKVRNDEGFERTLWGVGIEEAIEKAEVDKGDKITLVDRGEQPVSVPDPKNQGQYIDTIRRTWEAERYEAPLEQNSIEPVLEREIEQLPPTKDISNGESVEVEDEELESALLQRKALPQSIENSYVAIAKNRLLKDAKINYYDKEDYEKGNKGIAFEDRNKSLNTSRNDEKTVKAMLDLAQNKGWSAINIKGEQEFKRKMWLEANLRGMETRGYTPTEQDKADLQILQEGRTTNEITNDVVRSKQIEAERAEAQKNAPKTAVLGEELVNENTEEKNTEAERAEVITPVVAVSVAEQYRSMEGARQNISDLELQDIEARMTEKAEQIIKEVTDNYTPEDVRNMVESAYASQVEEHIAERELELAKDTAEYQSARLALSQSSASLGQGQAWVNDAVIKDFDGRMKQALLVEENSENKNLAFAEAQNAMQNVAKNLPEQDALLMARNYQNSLAGKPIEVNADQKAINDISKAMMIEEAKAKEIYNNPDFKMPSRDDIRAGMNAEDRQFATMNSLDSADKAIDTWVEASYQSEIRQSVYNVEVEREGAEWGNSPEEVAIQNVSDAEMDKSIEDSLAEANKGLNQSISTPEKQDLIQEKSPEFKLEQPSLEYANSDDGRYTFIAMNENQIEDDVTKEQFVKGVLIKDNDTGERYKILALAEDIDKSAPVQTIPDNKIDMQIEYYVNDKELMTGHEPEHFYNDNKMPLNKLGISDRSANENTRAFSYQFQGREDLRPNLKTEQVLNSMKIENLREIVGKEAVRMPNDLKLAVEASKEAGFDKREQALLVTRNMDLGSEYRQAVADKSPEAKQLRVELLAEDLVREAPQQDKEKVAQFIDKYAEKTGQDLSETKSKFEKWFAEDKEEDKAKDTAKLVVSQTGDTQRATLENPTQTEIIERNEQLFEDASKKLNDKDAGNLHAMRQIIHSMYKNQPEKLEASLKQLDEKTVDVANKDIQLSDKSFEIKEVPQVDFVEPQQKGNHDRSI